MKLVNLETLLPKDLPPGERVLWFGRPEPVSLWRRAFRADWVAIYFALLTIWGLVSPASDLGLAAALLGAGKTLAAGALALAILGGLAWLSARSTLYVVTTSRLVMKVGIALPIFYNVPFKQIGSATLRLHADGTGDLPVSLIEGQRIAYLTLWPSARPFRFTRPEPALRCVDDARAVADLLVKALRDAGAPEARATDLAREPSALPAAAVAA